MVCDKMLLLLTQDVFIVARPGRHGPRSGSADFVCSLRSGGVQSPAFDDTVQTCTPLYTPAT